MHGAGVGDPLDAEVPRFIQEIVGENIHVPADSVQFLLKTSDLHCCTHVGTPPSSLYSNI
ncbi:hypothetical protein Bca101_018919 [Brassica carinata]